MESCIEELLKQWAVPPDIIQAFIENGVTVEILAKLSPEHIKELCPHLATRILLQEKIAELVTACAPTESNITTKDSEESNASIIFSLNDLSMSQLVPIATETKSFPNFDLQTLLQTTPGGNSILKFYDTNGQLNPNKRNQLTDIIVKHVYTHIINSRITYEDYNILAAKIITVFPKETVGTYFTHPIRKRDSLNGRSTIARGKLVDKVRNLIYKYGDHKRGRTESNSENEPPSKIQCLDLQALHNHDVIWLKENSEPWDEVLQRWKNTFHLRRENKFDNVHDFLLEWKILFDVRSDSLINSDFDLLHPNKGLNLYLNWDTFFANLIELKSTKDANILQMIQDLSKISDDERIPAQIDILGRLVPPRGRLSKKVKFTTQEAIESIFILAKSAGDIDTIIAAQKERARFKKVPVQPYIILQGSLWSCSSPLLIIDDIRYQFQTIIKAFDILFKVYHVLDARYPRAGDYLYLIIQRCVYNIQTRYDNVVSYIADVLRIGN